MIDSTPLLFVTVGTDHHPFDRLTGWIDGWLANGGRDRARCVVQCGTSHPPSMAEWSKYLGYEELQRLLADASAVVCHGGPATIMECRRHGLIPLVVPRRHDLGEHVDDHQGLFTERLAAQGEIRLISDRPTLWRLLDEVVADPDALRTSPGPVRVETTVQRFVELIERLMNS